MRILFMGTPDFAVASLRRLVADGHEVCGVFTQPDKPKNRGHKLVPTPVKEFALTENIPVYQPLKMRDGTALELVQSLAPELTVVAAYGRILPEDILEAPRYGSINVHSSLLPKYRGAAPINWAILNGEETTGVSIMYMAKELDAGDVILQKETPIGPDEDAQALTVRLADLGAEALSEAVAAIGNGTAARTPQDESRQTYASMLTKEMSPIDWTRSAREIDCQVRGLIPWPCAACELAGQRFPGLPVFLLGHSMGSFLARTYLIRYPGTVAGAILMGTGQMPPALVAAGRVLAAREARKVGDRHSSPLVNKLAFEAYNQKFAPNRTGYDWLSASTENVDQYLADPLCGGDPTIGLFREMLRGIACIEKQENLKRMNRNTPVLFLSGQDDPVGDMGKGVRRAYRSFRRSGVRDVEIRLYQGLRHEILQETGREKVYADVAHWLEAHLPEQ